MKKNLNVLVDEDLLKKSKIESVKSGVTISEVVRDALDSFISGKANKNSIPKRNNAIPGLEQRDLDEKKLAHARLLISRFPMKDIINKSLDNLARWEGSGVWVPAYGMWRELMTEGDHMKIMEAMIGQSEYANMLRQSPPYIGLVDRQELESVRAKAKP